MIWGSNGNKHMIILKGNPFLEGWAMHFTAKSNQIGPSEVTMDDDLLGTVRHVAKQLTSHVGLSGGRMGWRGAVGTGYHTISDMFSYHFVFGRGCNPTAIHNGIYA